MSPRFEPDLDKHRATTRVFERGEYIVELGEPQGVLYEKRDEDTGELISTVAGVRYPLEMVGRLTPDDEIEEEGDWGEAGEDVAPFTCYVHTEGAMPFTKRFLMAAAGYTEEEEDDFNEGWFPNHDLTIDGDPESDADPDIGEGWESVEGAHVQVTLDKDEYEGREQQTHSRFMPA